MHYGSSVGHIPRIPPEKLVTFYGDQKNVSFHQSVIPIFPLHWPGPVVSVSVHDRLSLLPPDRLQLDIVTVDAHMTPSQFEKAP